MFVHEKVMFEIYREASYDRRYRVVYFTELDEHNKDQAIAQALAGEHVYDGYLCAANLPEAKKVIGAILDRLNGGEAVAPTDIERMLAEHTA